MKRNEFIKKSTACGLISFLAMTLPGKQLSSHTTETNNNKSVNDVNREQITNLLKFVDRDMDDSTKQKVFGKLGYECFHCTNAEKWIKSMSLDSLLDFVNNGKSGRWKRIEYSPESQVLKVIGRKTPCDCAYSLGQQSPKSLCNYCCKGFMQELFGNLLGKKVRVTIDESIILGGDKCCTTIVF
jgi:hypothetical protein